MTDEYETKVRVRKEVQAGSKHFVVVYSDGSILLYNRDRYGCVIGLHLYTEWLDELIGLLKALKGKVEEVEQQDPQLSKVWEPNDDNT